MAVMGERERVASDGGVAEPWAGGSRQLHHPGAASSIEKHRWRVDAARRLAALLAVDPTADGPPIPYGKLSAGSGAAPQLIELPTGTVNIPAWLLVPTPERRRNVAVVALAGHGPGIDALVADGRTNDDYHGGVARKLQAAGFTVLCPELTSFGRRRTALPGSSDAENSCQVDAMRGLLTGQPVLGRRVEDARTAVAAARSLPWIDPARVAVLGGSGGGAVALFTAALDEQIAVAVVATYLSSFAASLCSVPHCICNAVPGLLAWFEMADVAAMIAPRGLIIEAGEADPIFPIAQTRATYAELVPLWTAAGARRPELVVTGAGHQFLADEAIASLVAYFDEAPPAGTGRRSTPSPTD
jgi:dienelactone hydrolase